MEGKTSGGHAVLENHQDSLRQAADWGKPSSSAEEPRLCEVGWGNPGEGNHHLTGSCRSAKSKLIGWEKGDCEFIIHSMH